MFHPSIKTSNFIGSKLKAKFLNVALLIKFEITMLATFTSVIFTMSGLKRFHKFAIPRPSRSLSTLPRSHRLAGALVADPPPPLAADFSDAFFVDPSGAFASGLGGKSLSISKSWI